jgi:FHA domain
MIACPACMTDNMDSSQYCDECGSPLTQPAGKDVLPAPEFAVLSSYDAAATSVGIPVVPDAAVAALQAAPSGDPSLKAKGAHARLVIERGASVGLVFNLTADESYIGRWDADNGTFPDVDLDAHDPEAKVSRRHARILRNNGKYTVEDLGSTNGTFVNRGRRLLPGTPHALQDGAEIIVGKTFLRFNIN